MKVVAVYKTTVEVWVELGDFDTWEDAAAAAVKKANPPPPKKINLLLEKIYEQRPDNEDYLYSGHEIIGTCHFCGDGITDGCRSSDCDSKHHARDKGGWTSTEHGHQTWCSTTCRNNDPQDYDRVFDHNYKIDDVVRLEEDDLLYRVVKAEAKTERGHPEYDLVLLSDNGTVLRGELEGDMKPVNEMEVLATVYKGIE